MHKNWTLDHFEHDADHLQIKRPIERQHFSVTSFCESLSTYNHLKGCSIKTSPRGIALRWLYCNLVIDRGLCARLEWFTCEGCSEVCWRLQRVAHGSRWLQSRLQTAAEGCTDGCVWLQRRLLVAEGWRDGRWWLKTWLQMFAETTADVCSYSGCRLMAENVTA